LIPWDFFLPVTIRNRLYFQDLIKDHNSWDSELTVDQRQKLDVLLQDCNKLQHIAINRKVSNKIFTNIELLIFSDASTLAYGCVIYIKENDKMNLLKAKGKIKSSKKCSIPRLELCGANLSVKTYLDLIKDVEQFQKVPVRFFTDSMAVLHWIKGKEQLPVFVENRINIIRENSLHDKFFHIAGNLNPADIITRGISSQNLEKNSLWWNGPSSLQTNDDTYALDSGAFLKNVDNDTLPNEEKSLSLTCVQNEVFFDSSKYGTFEKCLNIMFFILYFIQKCKFPIQLRSNNLHSTAKYYLFRIDQMRYFSTLFSCMKNARKHDLIRTLNLVIYNDLICVKTRFLLNEKLPHFLILLSNHSHLTTLLVLYYHKLFLHCGVNQTLNNIRSKFWIINGRKTIKQILRTCIVCQKNNKRPFAVSDFAPLPECRIKTSLPFINIGIDFAGPFLTKANLTMRSRTYVKSYICLFVCASSRAIHLELTLGLTKDDFLLAFDRFVARRGVPKIIYSDNAPTFITTAKDLETRSEIEWRFIPPRAPWWGGFYERMVQIVKNLLRKTFDTEKLHFIEFSSALVKIEGIINDRPLAVINNDCEISRSVTPSDLLLGRRSFETYETGMFFSLDFIKRRLKSQEEILKSFWLSFQKQYLIELKQHKNKQKNSSMPTVGQLVHIRDDNVARRYWKIGRITDTFEGNDGNIRAVNVRLPINGKHHETLKRDVRSLYPLEVENSDSESNEFK